MKQFILLFVTTLLCVIFCNAQMVARVSGTITDCDTGAPIEGVMISVGGVLNTTTNSEGIYNFEIEEGTYYLDLNRAGYRYLGITDLFLQGVMTIDTCMEMQIPSLGISPQEIMVNLAPGEEVWKSVTLTNNGESLVSYSTVVEYDENGSGWLIGLDQVNGVVMPGYMVDLSFLINPESLTPGQIYEATVCFYYGGGLFHKTLHVILNYGTVSVNEYVPGHLFSIVPNPVTSILTIPYNCSLCSYEVLEINGTSVLKGKLSQGQLSINTKTLSSGIYILKLEDKEHNVSVGKFVKN